MTKSDFIQLAYAELGFPNLWFSLPQEQKQAAARRIEDYLAEEEINGIRIGWPFSSNPIIDLTVECLIPRWANTFVYRGGAMVIAPTIGKEVSPDTNRLFKEARQAILNVLTTPGPRQPIPGSPRGAGNYPAVPYFPGMFFPDPISTENKIPVGNDNTLL